MRDGVEARADLEERRGPQDRPREAGRFQVQFDRLDLTFGESRGGGLWLLSQSGRSAVQIIERRRKSRRIRGCCTYPLRDGVEARADFEEGRGPQDRPREPGRFEILFNRLLRFVRRGGVFLDERFCIELLTSDRRLKAYREGSK